MTKYLFILLALNLAAWYSTRLQLKEIMLESKKTQAEIRKLAEEIKRNTKLTRR